MRSVLYYTSLENAIRFFLSVFILFIPMKTAIYPISYSLFLFFSGIYFYKNRLFFSFKDFAITYQKLLLAFGLVIASMVTSNLLSPYVSFGSWKIIFEYVVRYFLLFVVLIVLYQNAVISKRFLLISILCALSIQGIDGMYQAISGIDLIRGHLGSIAGEGMNGGIRAAMFHRNTFGLFMAIGITLSTLLLIFENDLSPKHYQTLFLSITIPFFIFGLLFSYSRSAWVFCTVFLAIYLFKEYKRLTYKHYALLLILIVSIVCFFLYFDTLFLRFVQLIHLNSSDRDIIWMDSIRLIQAHPIVGYGLMSYQKIASQNTFSVHNSFLEIMLFLGIVGFAAFSFLLYVALEKIVKIKNSVLLAFFVAFLVVSQFDHSIISNAPMLSALSLFAFFIFAQKSEPSPR